jgi:hypothetical protein
MKIHGQTNEMFIPDIESGSAASSLASQRSNEDLFVPAETFLLGGYSLQIGKNNVEWTAEIPEHSAYKGVIYIAPGFIETDDTIVPLRNALAERGYAAMTVTPSRRGDGGLGDCFRNPQEIHAKTMIGALRAIQESRLHQKLAPEIDFNKVLIVTHSMGGLAATQAIELGLKPEAVINIAAAGFGSPTVKELLRDLPRGLLPAIRHEVIPAVRNGHIDIGPRHIIKMIEHLVISPSQTIAEGISCLTTNNSELVRNQRALGIKIGYIALMHDVLVRSRPDLFKSGDIVDDYIELDHAGHFYPQKHPGRMADHIIAMHKRLTNPSLEMVSA